MDNIERIKAIEMAMIACKETSTPFDSPTAIKLIDLFEYVIRKQDLETRYICVEKFIELMKNNKDDIIKNTYDNFKEICLTACDSQI
jgi:hypothetical protein